MGNFTKQYLGLISSQHFSFIFVISLKGEYQEVLIIKQWPYLSSVMPISSKGKKSHVSVSDRSLPNCMQFDVLQFSFSLEHHRCLELNRRVFNNPVCQGTEPPPLAAHTAKSLLLKLTPRVLRCSRVHTM